MKITARDKYSNYRSLQIEKNWEGEVIIKCLHEAPEGAIQSYTVLSYERALKLRDALTTLLEGQKDVEI